MTNAHATIARQMGTQMWGICSTSSITEVVMQMKYNMGKKKNATVKTWGNELSGKIQDGHH